MYVYICVYVYIYSLICIYIYIYMCFALSMITYTLQTITCMYTMYRYPMYLPIAHQIIAPYSTVDALASGLGVCYWRGPATA